MAIKLADTLAPMADFPAVEAKDVAFNDNKSLQEKYDNGELGGGGTSITVDSAMSDTSTNPVQNKVIKAYVDSKSVDISADLDNAIQTKTDGIYVEKTKISTDDGNALSEKSNGLFVQDLSDKINQINFAQKTVNEGLDYCYCTLGDAISGQTYSVNDTFPFTMSKSNNMTCNSSNHSIILKKGKTYRISSDIQCNLTSASIIISIYNLTKGMNLTSFHKTVKDTASESAGTAIYTPDLDDEEIIVKIISLSGTVKGTSKPTDFGYFIAEEIGRAITIDPLEYANSESGIEDTPVGHIIPYMGNNAPKHYLICDGREYNIVDYPYLAQHFTTEFGSVNYFGGDGTTTFAVPDLRGEFLRGTGTATRNTGTGADVGVHQDGTRHANIDIHYEGSNNYLSFSRNLPDNSKNLNPDCIIDGPGLGRTWIALSRNNENTNDLVGNYTSKPTNTAVLYCIKYEPTYFMNLQYNSAVIDFGMINARLDRSDTRVRTLYEYVNNSLAPVRVKLSDLIAYTNTGGNEGYVTIEVEDVVTQTINLPTDTRTNITIPECVISQGKSLAIKTNWNGSHTGCYWELTGRFIAISDYYEMANGSELLYTDEEIQEAVAKVLGGTE